MFNADGHTIFEYQFVCPLNARASQVHSHRLRPTNGFVAGRLMNIICEGYNSRCIWDCQKKRVILVPPSEADRPDFTLCDDDIILWWIAESDRIEVKCYRADALCNCQEGNPKTASFVHFRKLLMSVLLFLGMLQEKTICRYNAKAAVKTLHMHSNVLATLDALGTLRIFAPSPSNSTVDLRK